MLLFSSLTGKNRKEKKKNLQLIRFHFFGEGQPPQLMYFWYFFFYLLTTGVRHPFKFENWKIIYFILFYFILADFFLILFLLEQKKAEDNWSL
jgi:hypothetical protein